MKSFIDQSRVAWGNEGHQGTATNEEIQTGCLQRIAAATEAMAKNYTQLQADLEWYKKQYNNKCEEVRSLHRRISALRGLATRRKNEKRK